MLQASFSKGKFTWFFETASISAIRIYVMDFSEPRDLKWSIYNLPIGVEFMRNAIFNESLHFGHRFNGFVFKQETGNVFFDDKVDSSTSKVLMNYRSGPILGRPEHRNFSKVWRYIIITCKSLDDDLVLVYTVDADGTDMAGSATASMLNTTTSSNTDMFKILKMDFPRTTNSDSIPFGHSITISLGHAPGSSTKRAVIYGYEVFYNVSRGKREN